MIAISCAGRHGYAPETYPLEEDSLPQKQQSNVTGRARRRRIANSDSAAKIDSAINLVHSAATESLARD
jgi:hypothetical protein